MRARAYGKEVILIDTSLFYIFQLGQSRFLGVREMEDTIGYILAHRKEDVWETPSLLTGPRRRWIKKWTRLLDLAFVSPNMVVGLT